MPIINITYQEKIRIKSYYSLLDEIADFWSHLSHKLFVDLVYRKLKRTQLKKKYLTDYGILARQFNSLYCHINGLIESRKEIMLNIISDKKIQIESLTREISMLESDSIKHGLTLKMLKQSDVEYNSLVKKKKKLDYSLHQKKRKLNRLKHKLKAVENDLKKGFVRICFGTKKLFSQQFKSNGVSHSEWKYEWKKSRNHMFFCVGSKDETNGNQNCQYKGDKLLLRLPKTFEDKYGKHLTIENVSFNYGNEMMERATQHYGYRINKSFMVEKIYQAVSYRFIRKKDLWYVHASLEYESPKEITSPYVGALGVDFNVNHLNCYHVDRYGNPINHFTLRYEMYSKSSNQIKNMLYKVTVNITDYAEVHGLMVVIENLDFKHKKLFLRRKTKKYKRMLSGFPFVKYMKSIESRCLKRGIAFKYVNPKNTSKEGKKVMNRFGCSLHDAAAYKIARKGLGYK